MLLQFSITNYSLYLLISFIISLFFSYLLYRNHDSLSDISRVLKASLFLCRFFSFFFLCLLLFNIKIKSVNQTEEYPRIVFLQDNSSSVLYHRDSLFYKTDYLRSLDSVFTDTRCSIDVVSFDRSIKSGFPTFTGSTTNLSSTLDDISDLYSNVNVGAYVLASDGIYNEGLNPLYQNIFLNAPLYTLLMGDTTQRKDALISSVNNNEVMYLGNKTPLEFVLNFEKMSNQDFVFKLFNLTEDPVGQNPIYSTKVSVLDEQQTIELKLNIASTKSGMQHYFAVIQSNVIEHNLQNNTKSFFIDVIDDRKKILILFTSPHPDVAAIQEALEEQEQYQVETKHLIDIEINNLADYNFLNYDLIIAHQLDVFFDADFNLNNYEIPVWYILGKNSKLNIFNQHQKFVDFNNFDNTFEFADVSLNKKFDSFSISDSLSDFLSFSIPFLTPFSEIELSHISDVLLYKKIGSISTDNPLFFFIESEYNSAYLLGEGVWRWKLHDSYQNNNNFLFNSLISKIVMYLFSDRDKRRLYIDYQPVQSSNKRVFFKAQLYDKNFELITANDIDMLIIDSIGTKYNYQFIPDHNDYYLDIPLSEGKYSFLSSVKTETDSLVQKGEFIISDFSIEKQNLVADYDLLFNLSNTHGGYTTTIDSLPELFTNITSSHHFKSRKSINYNYYPLINLKSCMILIIFLLFLEWFLRRRYINY